MFSSKKPYSSVTVQIERFTGEQYAEDDLSGIPDLVEVIKLQVTGPSEAARALRKKLKYGSVHRQIRALNIIDGLMQNAGPRFQRSFVDEPLLERLRVCGTSQLSDGEVRDRCQVLFAQWAQQYKRTPGLERVAALAREMPRRKQVVTQERSKVLKETERDPFEDDEDEEAERPAASLRTSTPTPPAAAPAPVPKPKAQPKAHKPKPSSSGLATSLFSSSAAAKPNKVKKSGKRKPFDLEAEKGRMKSVIAESSVASINLLNALQRINREQERVSENAACAAQFDKCKYLRRHILRYIQHVEAEEWLGALLQANDQLVLALMTFEQLDTSLDADSDSDDELAEQAHAYRMLAERGKPVEGAASDLSGLKLSTAEDATPPPAPPRPVQNIENLESESESEENEDEENPFGDSNALETPTPAREKSEPKW